MEESVTLSEDLDKVKIMKRIVFSLTRYFQERNDYLPLAKHGSKLFFVISDLSKVNNMYQFSLSAFLRLFQRNLQRTEVNINFHSSQRIHCFVCLQKSADQDRTLVLGKNQLRAAYTYITRSLFKADRLMFAMHLAHGMFPKKIPENVKRQDFIDFFEFNYDLFRNGNILLVYQSPM